VKELLRGERMGAKKQAKGRRLNDPGQIEDMRKGETISRTNCEKSPNGLLKIITKKEHREKKVHIHRMHGSRDHVNLKKI